MIMLIRAAAFWDRPEPEMVPRTWVERAGALVGLGGDAVDLFEAQAFLDRRGCAFEHGEVSCDAAALALLVRAGAGDPGGRRPSPGGNAGLAQPVLGVVEVQHVPAQLR